MEITGLSVYKGDTYKLELDDEQTFFINSAVVSDYGLRKGGEISSELLARLRSADNMRKAKKRALYLLGTRQYCYGELFRKLKLTYDEETARAAADSMREYGYVNDEEYAPKLAEHLLRTKKFGMRKARWEMISRGLDEALVEDVLAEYTDEDIDEEITALLSRKYSSKIEDRDDRRRTIAALSRRGYDYRAVKRCIERLLEESGDFEDDEDFE